MPLRYAMLWSIAYRKGIDCLRRNRRERQLEDGQENEIAAGMEHVPTVVTEGKETEQVVWEAVERLPRPWRVAVVLHYREEKAIADIAKIMDTRENTVKTYLFRGRQKLREMLSEALGENCNAGK